jgi:hypothetical protein
MLHRIYFYLRGWRSGVPSRNDDYFVQYFDGTYGMKEWVDGCKHWYKVKYWKLPVGPLALPPLNLTYSPGADRPAVLVPRLRYFLQRPLV